MRLIHEVQHACVLLCACYLDGAMHLHVCACMLLLKTGIANALNRSGDYQLWDDSSDDEGDQVEESLPLSLDADEDVPKEDWDKLFDDSECSDFDAF